MGKRKMTTQTTWLLWMRKIFAELLKVTRNPISLPIVRFTPDISFHTFYFFFLENNKEKILEILGRVSEKKKLDQLKMKYKDLYDKVRIIRSVQRIYVPRAILFLAPAYPGLSLLFHSPSFWFWIQELIEEVKPKLDEEMQMALECLGSGAEEDSKQLYEAMKVTSPCLQLFDTGKYRYSCLFFSSCLYQGIGTDDDILIEILCTRSNAVSPLILSLKAENL